MGDIHSKRFEAGWVVSKVLFYVGLTVGIVYGLLRIFADTAGTTVPAILGMIGISLVLVAVGALCITALVYVLGFLCHDVPKRIGRWRQ